MITMTTMKRNNGGDAYTTSVVYRDGVDLGHVSKDNRPFAKWRAMKVTGEYENNFPNKDSAIAFLTA